MSASAEIRFWGGEPLPATLAVMQAEARREGFSHIDALEAECFGANIVFAPPPARLAFAWRGDEFAGVGGLTRDPYDPAPERLRMRHFYVRPAFRREGIAQALASTLIAGVDHPIAHLTLFTDVAAAFWESIGFSAASHPSRSHERFLKHSCE